MKTNDCQEPAQSRTNKFQVLFKDLQGHISGNPRLDRAA